MDTASDKALQRFATDDRKDKAGGRQLAEAWFGIKGGGLPQNIEGRTYNGVKFLHVVSTFGKRAVQPAGLYDLHASQRQRP